DDAKLTAAREAYLQYATTLLGRAGVADPAAAAREVLELETTLAGHQWDRTRNRDREASYNAFEIEELRQLTAGFDWRSPLEALDAAATPIVVVRQPDYFTALGDVLASTPVPVWRNYLTVRLLDSYAEFLDSELSGAAFEFRGRTLQGL